MSTGSIAFMWCRFPETKAIEQCFPVELFLVLYKVALTFEYANEIPNCERCSESN